MTTSSFDFLAAYGADDSRLRQAAFTPRLSLARVIGQDRGQYTLIASAGECTAQVSGSFRHKAQAPLDFPAVGDFVLADTAQGIIHQLLPRKSVFTREAVGDTHAAQAVAANVDVVFLCLALNGNYSPNRLERYLAAAWASGAAPVVVLTQADLCPQAAYVAAQAALAAPGAAVLTVSRLKDGWRPLEKHLAPGRTAAFIGSSGVGKSTLINCLAGEALAATAVTRRDGKGRHTTTRRELLRLPQGGLVIDTPGMRQLALEEADISQTFRDIQALAQACRFRDCTHEREPGCAVRQAILSGQLDPRRLASYQKLQREARYAGLDARQLESAKMEAMFKEAGGMKKARRFLRENDKRRSVKP